MGQNSLISILNLFFLLLVQKLFQVNSSWYDLPLVARQWQDIILFRDRMVLKLNRKLGINSILSYLEILFNMTVFNGSQYLKIYLPINGNFFNFSWFRFDDLAMYPLSANCANSNRQFGRLKYFESGVPSSIKAYKKGPAVTIEFRLIKFWTCFITNFSCSLPSEIPRSKIFALSLDRLKLLNASRKEFAGSASCLLSEDLAAEPN